MPNAKRYRSISQLRETNALVRIIQMGEREIRRGEFLPLALAKAELDKRIFGQLPPKTHELPSAVAPRELEDDSKE